MESKVAVEALAAIARDSRLQVHRLLIQAGPEGTVASEIAEHLRIPGNTVSFHLKSPSRADLVASRHEGRFVYYSANCHLMNSLLGFLTENCCGGWSCVPARSITKSGEFHEALSPPRLGSQPHAKLGLAASGMTSN